MMKNGGNCTKEAKINLAIQRTLFYYFEFLTITISSKFGIRQCWMSWKADSQRIELLFILMTKF